MLRIFLIPEVRISTLHQYQFGQKKFVIFFLKQSFVVISQTLLISPILAELETPCILLLHDTIITWTDLLV